MCALSEPFMRRCAGHSNCHLTFGINTARENRQVMSVRKRTRLRFAFGLLIDHSTYARPAEWMLIVRCLHCQSTWTPLKYLFIKYTKHEETRRHFGLLKKHLRLSMLMEFHIQWFAQVTYITKPQHILIPGHRLVSHYIFDHTQTTQLSVHQEHVSNIRNLHIHLLGSCQEFEMDK